MKKILVLAATATIILAIAGCNNSGSDNKETTTTMAAPVETTTEAPVTTTKENPAEITTEAAATVDEAAAKEIAETLLKRDTEIADKALKAQYKTGEETVEFVEDDMVWQFAPIADDSCPFSSVDEIKAYVEDTYDNNYLEFSNYSKYLYENGNSSMYKDYEGTLYMNVTGGGGGGNIWAYDTLSISSITEEKILGYCDGQTTYGEPTRVDFVIALTDNGWRIDALASL